MPRSSPGLPRSLPLTFGLATGIALVLCPAGARADGDDKARDGGAAAPQTETVRRGVVQVEQAGRPIAIGSVLGKDGRILTSLSGLGTNTEADIRYADGTVVKAKLGHEDRAWDLALLVPQTGKWSDGLTPSGRDPQGIELKSFLPKGGKLGPTIVGYKGRVDARPANGDAATLNSALEIDLKGSTPVPGAPIIDPEGKVIGVLVRVCKEKDEKARAAPPPASTAPGAAPKCPLMAVGAPVYALRNFLVKTPANAVQPTPWLGLGGAPMTAGNIRGVKVMGLAPGSPAEKSGLKAEGENADVIVAVDGQPVETPEQLAEAIGKHAVGQTVKLLAFAGGKFREVPVTLRAAP